MAMVSAGRILILPKGAWNNATTYQMLDMVTGSNNAAYIAKQASVNVDPVSDTSQTYWQPFGSSLAADGTTIVDNNGTISVPIDGASIYIDSNDGKIKAALSTLADVDITNIGNGKVLAWNTTSQKWEAVAISSSFSGLTDVNFTNLQNGQVPKYNSTSQKWENASDAGGLVPHLIIISETGSVVTVSKGLWSTTATETSTGHFECDVPEFGTYTIDAVLGGDDAQVSLVVDAVKIYTVDDSHFHADITVTYPTGATVSCSKTGEATMYATGSPYTFTVHSSGTWTITCAVDGYTYTANVAISTSGQTESLTLPTGSTVTPTDDVKTLVHCAGLSASGIDTLADLLADSTSLLAVTSSNNAVDYLVRSTTWATDFCADSTAMTDIGANNYCADTLLADSTWLNAICNSTYFESVLNVKVPTMTSNTTPSGECFADNVHAAGEEAYHTFDGVVTGMIGWASSTTNSKVGYRFDYPVNVRKVRLQCPANANGNEVKNFKIQYSDDGTTFTDASETLTFVTAVPSTAQDKTYNIDDVGAHRYWAILAINNINGDSIIRVTEAQFYGREDV